MENELLDMPAEELSEFDFSSKDLYLTLDANPETTDEELFEWFPEFNNNTDILEQAKIRAMDFGGEQLKKKDETTVSDVSLEGSDDSESETPSTSEFDAESYRRGLSAVESSGEIDYSLTAFKDEETGEPISSAVGPYQFLYNTHAELLKTQFGVNSKEEFIGNKEAQEGLMDYMLEDKPGRYPFMARRLEKDYKEYMPEELNYNDLVALEHFVGHGDLRKLFARVRDEKDFNAEDIYETSPKGKNLTIGEYLKRYRGGYSAGEPTGMESPLEDPNLLAAGEDLPPGDYTTGDDDREFTKEEKELLESFDFHKNWNLGEGEKDEIMNIMKSREPGSYLYHKSWNAGLGKYELILEDKESKKTIYDSSTPTKEKEEVQYKEVLGPEGEMVTIPVGEDVTEEDIQVAATGEGVDTRTSTQIKEGIIDKVNASGKKINETDLNVLVEDFEKQYEQSKVELTNDIIDEIDNIGLTPLSAGFNNKVIDIIDSRAFEDLQGYISNKNENITIKKENLESDILKLAPQILYNYYTGPLLDKAYEEFEKLYTPEYQAKKAKKRQELDRRKKHVSPRDMPSGYSSEDFNIEGADLRKDTKADISKDIIIAAHEILEKEKYDNIPESWIAIMAEEITDRHHKNTPEYIEARDMGRMKALESYNLNNPNPLILPEQKVVEINKTWNDLGGIDSEIKKEIIKRKHEATINDDGGITFDDKYIKELNKVIGKSDNETFETYKKANATEKNIIAEGFEQTLFVQAITLMTDKPTHPEWGVEYTPMEQLGIGVLGITLDLALPIIGYGVNIGTKAAINTRAAFLANQQKNAILTHVKSNKLGLGWSTSPEVIKYRNLVAIKQGEALAKYSKKVNIVGGSANLFTWMAALDLVSQQKETHDIFDIDYAHVLKKGVEGGTLGIITGKIGYATKNIQNQITSLGFKALPTYAINQSVSGASIIPEAIAFTGISAVAGEGGLTIDDLTHNLAFIVGLRGSRMPVKVAKGEFFKSKDVNLGIYGFKTTEAERQLLGLEGKTDKEIFKMIKKELNGNEKDALKFMDALPTQTLGKYAWSSTGSKLIATNPLDGVITEYKTNSERPGIVEMYNSKGQLLDVKKFNNEAEAVGFINKGLDNIKENQATTILDNNLLSPENKAKIKNELGAITMQEVKDLHATENKSGDQKIIAEKVNDKIIEIHNEQVKKEKAALEKFEKETEGMSIEQKKEVLKARVKEAKATIEDIKQKEEAGIEEVTPWMRLVNEALGKKADEPIEVNEENLPKLKEAAKTDLQKEAIQDIITATELLKNIPGKVIVHTDASSYQKALDAEELGHIAEHSGGHRVTSGKNKGDVHFNLPSINERTPFHELAGHKLIENIRESNPEKIERIENEVYDLIKKTPEFAPILDFINLKVEGKEAYTEAELKSEALAEFIARSSKGEFKLEQNSKFVDGLKVKLNTLMEKLGIDYTFATNSEALTFVATIAKDMSKGKAIEVEKGEKKDLFKEKELSSELAEKVNKHIHKNASNVQANIISKSPSEGEVSIKEVKPGRYVFHTPTDIVGFAEINLNKNIVELIKFSPGMQGKGLGTRFYETLIDKNILVESSPNQKAGGKALWEGLVRKGLAVEIGEGKFQLIKPETKIQKRVTNPETKNIAKEYIKKNKNLNIKDVDIDTNIKLDVDNSKKIADAYEAMKHEPNNPEVKKAYKAMANETIEQYKAMLNNGYTIELFDGKGESYPNSKAMIADVKNNKRLVVFSTEQGYGEKGITAKDRKENPLLADSGYKDSNGNTLLVNDIFRGVHDFFGHTEHGNGFGPKGEEIAWRNHSRMYSPLAMKAMTTETRGQNSWVNFGPQMRKPDGSLYKKGEKGYLPPAEREFAPQKIGFLPKEFMVVSEVTVKPLSEKQITRKDFNDRVKTIRQQLNLN